MTILMQKTEFELAIEEFREGLSKLQRADDLRKGLRSLEDVRAEGQAMLAEINRLGEVLERARAALPAFEKWARGPYLTDLAGGSVMIADKSGKLSPFAKREQPVDLKKAATHTMWQRNRHLRED